MSQNDGGRGSKERKTKPTTVAWREAERTERAMIPLRNGARRRRRRRAVAALAIPLLALLSSSPSHARAGRARITMVNGVAHSFDDVREAASGISSLFGGQNVECCHNPTAMTSDDDYVGWGKDLTQAGTHKLGRRTAEVDSLVSHLRTAVSQIGERGRVVHIAHSQGALITSLAARRLAPSELSRIEVISFGGGAALRRSPETPFARCVNYYSVNDPILAIVPSAERALRSGFLGVCSSEGGFADEPEFVFLTPRGGDPMEDHQLLGPTYAEALGWEGRRFQRLYQPAAYRAMRAAAMRTSSAVGGLSARVHRTNVAVLKRTVVPLVMFVMAVNAWIKARLAVLVRTVVVPLVILVRMVWEWIREAVRTWREGEEKYVPVPGKKMSKKRST